MTAEVSRYRRSTWWKPRNGQGQLGLVVEDEAGGSVIGTEAGGHHEGPGEGVGEVVGGVDGVDDGRGRSAAPGPPSASEQVLLAAGEGAVEGGPGAAGFLATSPRVVLATPQRATRRGWRRGCARSPRDPGDRRVEIDEAQLGSRRTWMRH